MSVRLTKSIRGIIAKRALAHAFDARAGEIKAMWDSFGEEVYNAFYTPEIIAKMKALPDYFFPEENMLYATFNGMRMRFELRENKPVAYKYRVQGWCIKFGPDSPETIRFEEINDLEVGFQEARRNAEQDILRVLESVSTTKRLLEVWPESEPFLGGIVQATTTALAVPMADLNARLGLPVDGDKK